ncbi:MAG: hypothetical protein K8R41_03265, partial [Bacteroidales bacterium]|nr:hypothetical protein [Bacteroidales bacterium]
MKKHLILLITALFTISVLIISCSGSPEKSIPGLWKAETVEANVDSTKISNEQISKGVEIQKSISFEYFKDHTMDVITPDGSFSGTWSFSAETNEIFIRIDGSSPKDSTIMGKFEDGKIISNNVTPVG